MADVAGKLAFSAKAKRTSEQPISFLISAALGNPHLINFAAGLVDPRTLPVEEVARAASKVLSDPVMGRGALQYDTTLGLRPLREWMLRHIEAMEGKSAASMGVTADSIVVTTGSQQALYIVADVMVDPGDIVIAENPSYFVYTGALASFGARVWTAPMDEMGVDVETIEHLLAKAEREGELHRVKFIYVTPYFQNPTGITLAMERRVRLLELVKRYAAKQRILILEDAAYRELRFEGAAWPSIKSMDHENRFVVLAHTFSKPFAPGVKTGYTAMPSDLLEAVVNQKGNHDFGSSSLNQYLCLEAVRSGDYLRHVEVLKEGYRAKRDATLSALEEYMPAGAVRWTRASGGLYTWVTLPRSVDTSRGGGMFEEAVKAGVLYVPGEYCMQADETGEVPRNSLRLCWGSVPLEKIEEGVEKLASVISGQLSVVNRGVVELGQGLSVQEEGPHPALSRGTGRGKEGAEAAAGRELKGPEGLGAGVR